MNKVGRRLVGIPAGSWTKWLVVGFWVVIFAVAYPLAGKLGHAEKNDASAWLPASAESVKVLDVQSRVQSPNTYSGVVVYYRASGLTAADRAKAAADARRFAGLSGAVPGQVAGPIVSADGTAMQTIVPVNVGTQGWNGAIAPVDAMRAIAGSGADGMTSHVTGLLGIAADSA
jgi:RND superfamily putative drug exporter